MKVYVTSNKAARKVYHTDRNCPQLNRKSTRIVERDRRHVSERGCKYCTDEDFDPVKNGAMAFDDPYSDEYLTLADKLQAMDPDEI